MRKVLITAASALLLTSIALPVTSFANELDDENNIENPRPPLPGIDDMHSELEERYEQHSWLLIPPTVMRMGQVRDPDIFVLPTFPSIEGTVAGLDDSASTKLEQVGVIGSGQESTLDPFEHSAIPIDSLNISTATPADEFVEGAKVLGIALGVAALGLSTLTGVNTFQSRRRKLRYLKASGQ